MQNFQHSGTHLNAQNETAKYFFLRFRTDLEPALKKREYRYPKNQMIRPVLLTFKDFCIFTFAFVQHAYLLISVCKMNYHTDIVNF